MGRKYKVGDRVRLLDVHKDDPPELGTVIEVMSNGRYRINWDNGTEQGVLEYRSVALPNGKNPVRTTRNNVISVRRITPCKEEE